MKIGIKGIFKDEEKKLNKLAAEINKSNDLKKKAEIAKEVLNSVNQMISDLDNIKEHQEYKDYRSVLLVRKEVAETLIKYASEEAGFKLKVLEFDKNTIKKTFSK